MLQKVRQRTDPERQARELMQQRAVLLRDDRRRLDLAARVHRYEETYGMPSDRVHEAIKRGDLKERQEVCRWIMDYELLERATPGEER